MRLKILPTALVSFLAGALIATLVMARMHPKPDVTPIANAGKTIRVTAKVELKPEREQASAVGKAQAGLVSPLAPATGGARLVLSKRVLSIGDTITIGALLGEASGVPLFAFPPESPIYRDIMPDSSGTDVEALQRMLVDTGYLGIASGIMDPATSTAVKQLFTATGYKAPEQVGKSFFPAASAVVLPQDNCIVSNAAPPGTEITKDVPFAQAQHSTALASARVPTIYKTNFASGSTVSITANGKARTEAVVSEMSSFKEAKEGQPAGYDIQVTLPVEVASEFISLPSITIEEKAIIAQAPSVPLAALRYDESQNPFVLRVSSSSENPNAVERIPVTVRRQFSGLAVIEPNPELPEGTDVLVAG